MTSEKTEMTPEEIKAEIKNINETMVQPNAEGCCGPTEKSEPSPSAGSCCGPKETGDKKVE